MTRWPLGITPHNVTIAAWSLAPVALYFSCVAFYHLKPVWLWTDFLVYVLIASMTAFFVAARRRAHLREPLTRIIQNRTAMVCLVVLAAFTAIGVLDSVHFRQPAAGAAAAGQTDRYAPEVTSVLDALMGPQHMQMETTYSAPLSLVQYEKSTVERADGVHERVFPRLKFAGVGVAAGDAHTRDIVRRVVVGALSGLLATAAVAALFLAWYAYTQASPVRATFRRVLRGEGDVPWRAMWVTLLALCMIVGVVVALADGYHVFGTDKVGKDVLYKSVKSIRTGLIIGTLTTLVMLPFAVLLGILAGYLRGWVDDVIQYVYTTLSSIPGVLLIAASVLMLQTYIHIHPELFPTEAERADLRLLFLCIILGITSWTGLCRLIRGETMKLCEADFLLAARGFGAHPLAIMLRHILPNVMHIVLISVVLDFSGLVLAEAVLSYVGVGVDPSTYSWGNMINAARLEMAREPMVWWPLLSAFVFMFVLVLAANLFADVVRDAFDPRLKRR
ncbi:MAG: ABC transporter permease [Gammaproteobacteria bacterium]|nr:ABC transporter permease [Gammaproteobacteria bacterium]